VIAERDARDGAAEGFAELPHLVYAGDPLWIPEEPASIARAFDAANPWLAEREARTWCAPGKARVAAFFDPKLRIDGEACAFFGYWESRDLDAARALVSRVRAWASARGAKRLFGPIQFSTAHSYRVRTSTERERPLVGEPYNPPSYAAELESLGFVTHQRYVTTLMSLEMAKLSAGSRKAHVDAALARGYRVEPLTVDAWTSRLPELHAVVEESFKSNFGYTPMRYEEFASLCGAGFVKKFDPGASLLAFSPDDRVVGFALNARDFSPLVVAGATDRVPASAIDHATHTARLPNADLVMKTICVLPEHRKSGIMGVYAAHLVAYAESLGTEKLFGALVREDNPSRHLAIPGAPERWFALYSSAL